jgi:hypothetical protein
VTVTVLTSWTVLSALNPEPTLCHIKLWLHQEKKVEAAGDASRRRLRLAGSLRDILDDYPIVLIATVPQCFRGIDSMTVTAAADPKF